MLAAGSGGWAGGQAGRRSFVNAEEGSGAASRSYLTRAAAAAAGRRRKRKSGQMGTERLRVWTGRDWTGLDWSGLNWSGLVRYGMETKKILAFPL